MKHTLMGLTDTQKLKLKFWIGFIEYCDLNGSKFKLNKTWERPYYDVFFGSKYSHISLTYITKLGKNEIACELYIPNNKQLFHSLEKHKDEINSQISPFLNWQLLSNKKTSRIKLVNRAKVYSSGSNWNESYKWLKDNTELFIKVFQKYLI